MKTKTPPDTYLLLTRLNGLKPDSVQTLGEMVAVVDKMEAMRCKTMELPWRDNKKRLSCIPTGVYKVVKRHSPKYKEHFHILDVPDRSYILIHPANYSRQLLAALPPPGASLPTLTAMACAMLPTPATPWIICLPSCPMSL